MIATLYADGTLIVNAAGPSNRAGEGDTLIYYAPKRDADECLRARPERAEAANARSQTGGADAAGQPA